ncbi:MAG: hypothetical protein GC190_06170 [Alphaproteobacteria bacterium]|nr:hypothetical protein [Alphaproteobacteria bacterium]
MKNRFHFAALALILVFGCLRAEAADGLSAWSKIEAVLKHPRCLNCHQATAPLQGDEGKPHVPRVSGGPNGAGTGGMRCATCHKPSGNDEMTGTPGAKGWRLAPASMTWQGKSPAELCAALKDPKTNGNRNGEQLIEHVDREPLVLWGWSPGGSRKAVPLAHKDMIALMHQWVAGGMPCPK